MSARSDGSESARPHFAFSAGPHGAGELEVVSFTGTEAVSRPYAFDVVLVARSTDHGALGEALLGERALLGLHGAADRTVRGIVSRVEPMGAMDEQPLARLRIVPRLWLLGRRKTSRIFQDKTAPEIVDAVLADSRVERAWKTARSCPKREYCVQYRETDLHFITRLLAEEGIFYFFGEPAATGGDASEVVVFADGASEYEAILGDSKLHCRSAGSLIAADHVTGFALRSQVRAGAALLKSFDFKRPAFDLRGEARVDRAGGVFNQSDLRVYDHGGDIEEGDIDGRAAKVRLEQLRAAARVGAGESTCRRLTPGGWFDLEDHDSPDLNRRYAVIHVEHEGRQPAGRRSASEAGEPYKNRFRCVPADVACRPSPPRRRLQQVTETATVTGPLGEEIHVDDLGRVKVQFHWDLEGKRDESSSCWLRAMQPWAGSAWGSQFIPRIGMEVVVTFVGGDMDRPMILGSVYNAMNPPPFSLPAKKTQSGIRTRSTPGGAGSNELRFEDAASQEQIYLHAQKDLDEVIEHDHTRVVHGAETISVDKTRTVEILEDHVRTVHGNEVITVNKHFVLHVVGRQIIQVDGASADGGADGIAPPAIDDGRDAPKVAIGGPSEEEKLLEKAAARQKVAAARMLFLVEQLPDDLYARGKGLSGAAGDAADRLLQLQYEARAVEALTPVLDASHAANLVDQARALAVRARAVKEMVNQALASALLPAPPPLQRLQTAAIEHLQDLGQRADRTERALARMDPAKSGGAPSPGGGGGSGSGGGGADISEWSNKGNPGESVMTISKGGGIIDSPDGITLKWGAPRWS